MAPRPVTQAPSPVLRIDLELNTGRFTVRPDGVVVDDNQTPWGRIDADGTLYRQDGSVFARVGRDGSITLDDPSRVTDASFGGARIVGDALRFIEQGVDQEYEHVEGDVLVREDQRLIVPGLTPDRVRTVLAMDFLVGWVVLESESHGYF